MSQEQLTFGALLRRFRLAAGLTQEELAGQASLSLRGISDLERGINTRPRPYTVRQLADALNLSTVDRAALVGASTGPRDGLAVPHNLPFELTSLIDRERELARALHLLRERDVRLLTLTGPGGVGKSRLAQAIAGELLPDVPDGVMLVSLAAIRDPTLVIPEVASALSLGEEAGEPLLDAVALYLRERRLLLVLDNLEQVIEVAPAVVDLLTRCPALRVLVTSRMPLQVRGEHELNVPPLATPELQSERRSSDTLVGDVPSVTLFVQRAQAVKPDFELNEANADDIAQLCRNLDGLPLAIELAAAQVKYLSPRMLLAQFDRRLDLLTTGAQDLPPRQRTMRDAIAWSYDLLAAEQTLFRRLAVFSGGCDIAAISDVCAGYGDLALEPLRAMFSLVDRSLVTIDDASGVEPRFGMLETIREFAQEQLDARGETADLRRRHAGYYLALAEQAEPALWGTADVGAWIQRLTAELDNVRRAFTWYLEVGQGQQALRLAGLLGMFFFYTGRYTEGRRWLEGALDSAPDADPQARARALAFLGSLAFNQSDHARALPVIEESLALFQVLGDDRWTAFTYLQLAHVRRDAGDKERSRPLLEASLALSAGQGESWGIVRGLPLISYSMLLLEGGDPVAAVTHLEEALAFGRRSDNPVIIGAALNGLSWTTHDAGESDRAIELAEAALALLVAAGHHQGRSDALSTLGWVNLWAGHILRATEHFLTCLQHSWERGSKRHTANALRGLGMIALEQEHPALAVRRLAQATTLWPVNDLPHAPSKAAIERRFAGARAQLGDATWQTAWAAGAAMTPDEAVAEALN